MEAGGKCPPSGDTVSSWRESVYPKQVTWPSAVATTTLRWATEGEEVWRAELGPVFDHLVAATRSTRVRSPLCSAV